ncbi:hypothetical protein [Streptomyces sp. NPDC017958]|uniref:hypothetical protein n=1 Tax=Streptomyces sp. NPDC017958 TaxID=3365021 RepID=UPI0037B3F24C
MPASRARMSQFPVPRPGESGAFARSCAACARSASYSRAKLRSESEAPRRTRAACASLRPAPVSQPLNSRTTAAEPSSA